MWDYPRPPRVEPVPERIRVLHGGVAIVDTTAAMRVLETTHPPTYYVPRPDVRMDRLVPVSGSTFCEFKGSASYFAHADAPSVPVAWAYESPSPGFEAIQGHLAFYAERVDECWVGEEKVEPQAGNFYGGWITSWVKGPFKGGPGTFGW